MERRIDYEGLAAIFGGLGILLCYALLFTAMLQPVASVARALM